MTAPTPIEQLQADVAAMRADITRLQTEVATLRVTVNNLDGVEQTRQQVREWQRTLPQRGDNSDPKPRDTAGTRP